MTNNIIGASFHSSRDLVLERRLLVFIILRIAFGIIYLLLLISVKALYLTSIH